MPLYEFRCPKCGHEIELLRDAKNAFEAVICKKCLVAMKKMQSKFSFVFKDGI